MAMNEPDWTPSEDWVTWVGDVSDLDWWVICVTWVGGWVIFVTWVGWTIFVTWIRDFCDLC